MGDSAGLGSGGCWSWREHDESGHDLQGEQTTGGLLAQRVGGEPAESQLEEVGRKVAEEVDDSRGGLASIVDLVGDPDGEMLDEDEKDGVGRLAEILDEVLHKLETVLADDGQTLGSEITGPTRHEENAGKDTCEVEPESKIRK